MRETPSHARYDRLSRFFHWAMAACFAVVFAAALAHYFLEDTVIEAFLWPAHKPVGALLMVLVVLRASWAFIHRAQRPRPLNAAAQWGHRFLYLLMFAIPAIALLRQYGSGRAFAPFGIPLMAERPDDKIEWMTSLGGLLHGELGWVLLAAVAGHVTMAVWHRRSAETDVLPRMIG